MDKSWADRIKRLEAAGWSLKAIGEAIGLSQGGVGDIKHGRTASPNGDAAVALHALDSARIAPPKQPESRAA